MSRNTKILQYLTWHGNGMSLATTLCLLTIFIILSLDIGTVSIQDMFFETASSQVFNNTGSVIQNKQLNLQCQQTEV
jgi:hypothetical protein